jgi:hypothetical protein
MLGSIASVQITNCHRLDLAAKLLLHLCRESSVTPMRQLLTSRWFVAGRLSPERVGPPYGG